MSRNHLSILERNLIIINSKKLITNKWMTKCNYSFCIGNLSLNLLVLFKLPMSFVFCLFPFSFFLFSLTHSPTHPHTRTHTLTPSHTHKKKRGTWTRKDVQPESESGGNALWRETGLKCRFVRVGAWVSEIEIRRKERCSTEHRVIN